MKTNKLHFQPLPGLASTHLQTVIAFCLPSGRAPQSKRQLVDIGNGDFLSCEISIPLHWKESDRTVVLVHGMGGSHTSSYMIRLSRKIFRRGIKVVRVNLRGCGSGKGLSKLPYHAGTSSDLLKVVQCLKRETPSSEIILIGFSLGGNITLKLAGELGREARELVKSFITVCPPLDLAQTVYRIQEKRNHFYHLYFIKQISEQAASWSSLDIQSLFDFDHLITAPLWGYKGAPEYYQECSCLRFLPYIQQSTHLLFTEDDPFIRFDALRDMSLSNVLNVWTTKHGGHMGFLGKTPKDHGPYWMDFLLLNWIDGDFRTNLQKI